MNINDYCQSACETATASGFHDVDQAYAHLPGVAHALQLASLARIVSEIGEAVEALRHGNPESEKIPGFSHMEEELSDTVVRIFDLCGYYGYDLQGAVDAKMEYNKARPYKHGKIS
jgi:NTP pyrophosphatase (non-canonical NTP hydrolase)